MDKDAMLTKITEIGTCEDQIQRITMLTELSDEVSKIYDNVDTLNTTINSLNENLTKSNSDLEKAQKANMDLFLRIGTTKSEKQVKEDSTGIKNPEDKKRKFEDLLKEEGDDK